MSRLPAVNYNTVRKLMGHLSIVAGQMDKNLMPVINLAPLWGPNILTVDSQAGHLGWFFTRLLRIRSIFWPNPDPTPLY